MAHKLEEDFVGFDKVSRVIFDELTRGPKCLTIISISGSAGQGKTTLANKIHNDRSIMYHFHKIAWCYVSKDCPTREILLQIIGDDHKGAGVKGLEMHDLADCLRKILKGRRYLIIVDDIWDVDAWHKLKWSFPDDNNGSRLLFTTRNHDLASHAKSNSISHRLPLFTNDESWELMKKMVFHSEACLEEFVAVGKRIVSYCKGLPLAVAVIAGVLGRTDQNLEMWDGVAENLKTHLAREGCTNVIELSYKYLPNHLKSCFLYFGAFPRGENIRAKKLKLLWIAEGFVNQSSEDLATNYLKDLVSQSLVVVTERSSMDGIKSCNVHDLLYDLCLEKAKEDNFLNWVEESSVVDQCNNYNSLHRLHIGMTTDPFIKSRPIISNKKQATGPLHSLLWSVKSYHSGKFSISFLESLKFLTVLDMDINRRLKGSGKFPEVILTMVQLRFMALQFGNSIRNIPPAIANLRILETLIIATRSSILLPISMWKMKRLRHISVRHAHVDLKGSCYYSVAYSNIERLGSVHLVVSDHRTSQFLQNFPKLKKLECSFEGHISLLFFMLATLTQLRSLKIVSFPGLPLTLDSFEKNPSVNYTKVENLKKLTLSRLQVPWSVLSEIGKQLPNLQVLKLVEQSFVGGIWKLEDGDFSKLRYLKLRNLHIEEMDVSNCNDNLPFPCLEHLSVVSCKRLKEIPSIFGEISSLNTIQVFWCSTEVKNSTLRILEQQRDFGNCDLEVAVHGSLVDDYEQKMKVREPQNPFGKIRDQDKDRNLSAQFIANKGNLRLKKVITLQRLWETVIILKIENQRLQKKLEDATVSQDLVMKENDLLHRELAQLKIQCQIAELENF